MTTSVLFFLVLGLSARGTEQAEPPPQPTLELEWEAVDEADAYEVKLVPSNNGEAKVFRVNQNKLNEKMQAGEYLLQIRSREKATGYWGTWSEPTAVEVAAKTVDLLQPKNEETIAEPKEKKRIVSFEWTPVSGAKNYVLKIWSDDPNQPNEFKTTLTTKRLNLPAGRTYKWQVSVEDEKDVHYQALIKTFQFSILGRQLLTPNIEKIKLPAVQFVRWSKSLHAESYHFKLSRQFLDETEWKIILEKKQLDSQIKFTRLPPARYRVEVTALAPSRVSSEPATTEFVVKPSTSELQLALASQNAPKEKESR